MLLLREECYNPVLAFSFFQYFHIHWFDKHIIVIHAKMGVANGLFKGVVHIFYKTAPLVTVLGQHP